MDPFVRMIVYLIMAAFCITVLIVRFCRDNLSVWFFQLSFYEVLGCAVFYLVVNINTFIIFRLE